MSTQIKHVGTAHKYCVVWNAGTDNEEVVNSFSTFLAAAKWATNKTTPGRYLDVMKLDNNGYLTTEF